MSTSTYLAYGQKPLRMIEFDNGTAARGDVTRVLVHGLGGSAINWMELCRHLPGRSIAIDLPGFGLSHPWEGDPIDNHVEAVCGLIDWIDGPVSVVGNSLGGYVSEIVATKRPIESLVLVSPATPARYGQVPANARTVARLALQALPAVGPRLTRSIALAGSPADQVRRTLALITPDPAVISLAFVAEAIDLAAQRRTMPWTYDAFSDATRSLAGHLTKIRTYRRMIDEIEAPTMLLWGARDTVVSPASLEWLSALRPEWHTVIYPGLGHVPMLESPVAVAEDILGFIGELKLAG